MGDYMVSHEKYQLLYRCFILLIVIFLIIKKKSGDQCYLRFSKVPQSLEGPMPQEPIPTAVTNCLLVIARRARLTLMEYCVVIHQAVEQAQCQLK